MKNHFPSYLLLALGFVLFTISFGSPVLGEAFNANNKVETNNYQDDLQKSIARGKLIYNETCVNCHLGNGEGVMGTFPPLAKADFLLKQPDKSIAAVKYGLKGKITVNGVDYTMPMPNPGLDNEEIADVMNYIFNAWGNKSPIGIVTLKKVESIKP